MRWGGCKLVEDVQMGENVTREHQTLAYNKLLM